MVLLLPGSHGNYIKC